MVKERRRQSVPGGIHALYADICRIKDEQVRRRLYADLVRLQVGIYLAHELEHKRRPRRSPRSRR